MDFKVSQHIFEKCIKGLLGAKTRVLTSHQEQDMKEANNVIVLYKGRKLLGKGSFTVLKEEGFLNTVVDPLYNMIKEMKSDNIFDWDNEKKVEASDSCPRFMPKTTEANGLQMSEEDRAEVALAAILVSQDAGKYISRHGSYSLVHFVLAPESYCASRSTSISSLRTHILF